MNRRPAFTISFAILALLLACSTSGAREGNAPSVARDGKQYREGLSGVDFTGMSEAQKTRALDIMNANKCTCGCGMSIAECRVVDPTCPKSPGLAKAIMEAVKTGKKDAEIVAALQPPAAPAGQAQAPRPAPGPVSIDLANALYKGNPKAKVTLVEYADFQCPYCVRAVPLVKTLLDKYPQDLRFTFKQLPLTSIHKFAEPAARANLAAGRQGKYWEMYDVLFNNSRALDDASLRKYAQDLGLDMARFDKDFADPALLQAIQKDVEESQRNGVNGTPTFFINSVRVPLTDPEVMSQMIEAGRSGGDVASVAAEVQKKFAEQQAAQRAALQAQMANTVHQIDLAGAPLRGDAKAPVTLVEFGDFQCPFCANAQPLIKQVMDAYPGKVRLAFKHMPLTSIHPNARPASLAAAEAMKQGKFWEMHDLLYQNYNKLDRANLSTLAKQVGLNMDQFEAAMANEAHRQVVDKDVSDAGKYQVSGTPTFFVNGKRVMQRDFATFQKMIDEALGSGNASASR